MPPTLGHRARQADGVKDTERLHSSSKTGNELLSTESNEPMSGGRQTPGPSYTLAPSSAHRLNRDVYSDKINKLFCFRVVLGCFIFNFLFHRRTCEMRY